jgi:rubredoxin
VDQKTRETASEDPAESAAVCARCGATRQRLPVTWTCSVEGGDRRYFCDECARTHLRSIEGRLDSAWW